MKKTKRLPKWGYQQNLSYIGKHLIADFWFGKIIEDPKQIKKILIRAIKEAGNTPLKVTLYNFSPQGITGVVLLAESHLSIHTWPELNYVAVDIFTCGHRAFPEKALRYLKKEFRPKKVQIKKIMRGNHELGI
jgi:S-adenosylmethionine decarboxylase